MENLKDISNLVSQVRLISEKNSEILNASGGRFNMFKLCGVNHYENTHSAIIAEFLSPRGSHSLKESLLTAFVEMLGTRFFISNFETTGANVCTEYTTNEGRIDILVEDINHNLLIIENKVYANDQWEQLKRYDRFAKDYCSKYNSKYQILYLTLFGSYASEHRGEGVDYQIISYEDDIILWLEQCVAIAVRMPIVRETINQYINHLKELTNQDMDTKNKEEVTAFLSEIGNLKIAKLISQNYNECFNYLAQKYFSPKMKEFAKSKGLIYEYEYFEEEYIRFDLRRPEWNGACKIRFTYSKRDGYYYGIQNYFEVYRISDEERSILLKKLREFNLESKYPTEHWPIWDSLQRLTIDKWEEEIINSDKFLELCKEKIEILLEAIDMINLR